MSRLVTIVIAILASLVVTACGGHAVYRSQGAFAYRVAGLRPLALDGLESEPGGRAVELNSIKYRSLRGDGFVIDSPSGADLGVLDPSHGSFNVTRASEGLPVVTAAGDGRIRVVPPANTYSIGFSVYASGKGGSKGTVRISFGDGGQESDFPVTLAAPGDAATPYFGIVSFRPVVSATWIPPGPGDGLPETGLADIRIEIRN